MDAMLVELGALEEDDADQEASAVEDPGSSSAPPASVQLKQSSQPGMAHAGQPEDKAVKEEEARRMVALEKEAREQGYGKLYAAFGGGREGLEACAAGEASMLGAGGGLRAVHLMLL